MKLKHGLVSSKASSIEILFRVLINRISPKKHVDN